MVLPSITWAQYKTFPYQTENLDLVALPGDRLLAVFSQFYFPGNPEEEPYQAAMRVTSLDGGETWTEPELIGRMLFVNQVFQSSTGRLLLAGADFGPEGFEEFWLFSDDEGESWSPLEGVPGGGEDAYMGKISQTHDGILWRLGTLFVVDWENDIFEQRAIFSKSLDDGLTWSPLEELELINPEMLEILSIISMGNEYLALANGYDFSTDTPVLYAWRSGDEGLTWDDQELLLTGGSNYKFVEIGPTHVFAFYHNEEEVEVAGFPWPWFNVDIYYRESLDGGLTWGEPMAYTTYLGSDLLGGAISFGGGVVVSISATDRLGYGIWLLGDLASIDPAPPLVTNASFGMPRENTSVRVYAIDETGVASVTAIYGTDEGVFETALVNDGTGLDAVAGDAVWYGITDPLEWMSCIYLIEVLAVDGDGNVTASQPYSEPIPVLPVHEVGNAMLGIYPNGFLGGIYPGVPGCGTAFIPANLTWPKIDQYEFSQQDDFEFYYLGRNKYLAGGAPWLGATPVETGEPVVKININNYADWMSVAPPVVQYGEGLSDQDITVVYAERPVAEGEGTTLGLQVTQSSYQWSGPNRDDFIMIEYDVFNSGLAGDLQDVVVGLFFDADLVSAGYFPFYNTGAVDAESGLIYMQANEVTDPEWEDSNLEGIGMVGIKLLGAEPMHQGFFYNQYVPVNPAPEGMPRDPETFADVYPLLDGGTVEEASIPGDLRILVSAPFFDLASGESGTARFGIVMGADLDELRANAAVMDQMHAAGFGETSEGIAAMVEYIAGLGLGKGESNALSVSLLSAQASYDKGNDIAGDNKINAFLNKVEDMRGEYLTDEQADYLIFLSHLLSANS